MPEGERDEPGQAHGPERRVDSGHGAASVERNDGEQVEEVEEEAREGERDQKRGVERLAEAPDDHRAEGAEDRPGERDARFLPGIRRHLLHPDDGAEEGDEERRRSRHALAAELEDVAELVHEDQKDEADGEPPAPDPRIGRDRDEHRSRGREDLELEEREREELELREEGADRRERRDQLLPDLLPARLRMDRLVLALRLRLVERIVRLVLRSEWAHVRFIVASGRSLEPLAAA